MMASQEQKVGIFTLVAVVILGVVIFHLGRMGDLMKSWTRIEVSFTSASGLQQGSPVLLAGVKIGKVERIFIRGGKVQVRLKVERSFVDNMRQDSAFSLERDSLLGQWQVAISLGQPDSPRLDITKPIQGADAPDLVQGLQRILNKIERGEGTVGKLVNDETLYQDLKSAAQTLASVLGDSEKDLRHLVSETSDRLPPILADLQAIVADARAGKGVAGKLLTDEKMAKDFAHAIASISRTADALEKGDGALAKLINDPAVYDDLRQAIQTVKQVANKVDSGNGAVGRLLNDKQLADDLADAVASARKIAARLDNGEGFLGKLMTDEQLFNQIKHIVAKMEEAVESYKEQVPISAFGSVVFSAF